jgi:hypothetical protein
MERAERAAMERVDAMLRMWMYPCLESGVIPIRVLEGLKMAHKVETVENSLIIERLSKLEWEGWEEWREWAGIEWIACDEGFVPVSVSGNAPALWASRDIARLDGRPKVDADRISEVCDQVCEKLLLAAKIVEERRRKVN